MNKIDKSLPIYEVTIDDSNEETGVHFISLVENPAIEIDFYAFSAETDLFQFKQVGDQQKLIGPFIVPDLLIFRSDETHGNYYMKFSKEIIQTLADRFNEQSKSKNVNVEHLPESKINAFLSENWIIEDSKSDKINKYGFKDLPVGTWAGIVKIQDKAFWQEFIKTGNIKAFSIEALLGITHIKNTKHTMATEEKKFTKSKTKEGQTIETPAEMWKVGVEVFVINEDGTKVPYPDGETTLETGETFTIKDGKITDIKPAEEIPGATPAGASEQALEDPMKAVLDSIKGLNDRLTAIENFSAEIASLKTDLTVVKSELTKFTSEVTEKFSKVPGVKASTATTDKSIVKSKGKQSLEDRMNIISEFKKVMSK